MTAKEPCQSTLLLFTGNLHLRRTAKLVGRVRNVKEARRPASVEGGFVRNEEGARAPVDTREGSPQRLPEAVGA